MSRLLWPIGLLLVLAVLCMSALLWRADQDGEREDARDQGFAIELAELRGRFGSFLADLREPANGAEPDAVLSGAIAAGTFMNRSLTDVFLVSGTGEILLAQGKSLAAEDRTRPILAAILRAPSTEATLRVPIPGSDQMPFITTRLVGGNRHRLVLLVARLDEIWPGRTFRADATYLVGVEAMISSGPTAGSVQVAADRASRELSFQPTVLRGMIGDGDGAGGTGTEKAAPDRLAAILIAGLALATVLFAAIAFYFHRTTKDLAQTEALSKSLLGRDPLSGLANRLLLNERLDRELARIAAGGTGIAVMFIDLDRFKDVNDTYGHQAGDELIRLVADRILGALSPEDMLARLGGDEFAVIRANVLSLEQAEALARSVLEILTKPFTLSETQVTIGASIGVALAPEHARNREGLMKLADAALYQAKAEGRNRARFFQSHMDEAVRMRKVVEEELRLAIEQDQLVLHYQPLVSADGQRIVGLEALVRWPHPTRGMISPADFIPIAEERGLVIPLGDWVLRRACRDGCRWPGLRIAVNVSAIQFRHRDFVGNVTAALKDTGFEASRLELELTEGVVVADADAAEEAMVELRALGIHLALDDFGTGYSSLIYLRRFAFDKIKIDRSFLESMEVTGESAILVHSIVHLGRALGLVVTAEGVETAEQHRFLQALGCHQLQGFLFSRPVPADNIDRMLAAEVERASAA